MNANGCYLVCSQHKQETWNNVSKQLVGQLLLLYSQIHCGFKIETLKHRNGCRLITERVPLSILLHFHKFHSANVWSFSFYFLLNRSWFVFFLFFFVRFPVLCCFTIFKRRQVSLIDKQTENLWSWSQGSIRQGNCILALIASNEEIADDLFILECLSSIAIQVHEKK